MDTNAADAALVADLRRLVQRLNEMPDDREPRVTELGRRVHEHLGSDPAELPLVHERIAAHRLVDVDIALDALAARDPDAVVLGVSGGQERQHEDFTSLLRHRYSGFTPGPVEYTSIATGPRTSRQTIAFGVRLLRYDGEPIALLQRGASPMFGRETALIEVLSANPDATASLLAELRRLMNELSVVRGNVVSFSGGEYGQGIGGMTFLERPRVAASDVVLPDGLLQQIRDHVVGIGEHAEALLAHGQHLKRGVLLYGPPGTGRPSRCGISCTRRRGRRPCCCRAAASGSCRRPRGSPAR